MEKQDPGLQNPPPQTHTHCCFLLGQNPGFSCLFFQVLPFPVLFLVLSAWDWLNPTDVNGKCVLITNAGGAHLPAACKRCLLSPAGLPRWVSGKEPACQCWRHNSHRFDPWVGKIRWRRAWQPSPVFLPVEFHGQSSLAGYSSRGHKKLETTEQLSTQAHSQELGPRAESDFLLSEIP